MRVAGKEERTDTWRCLPSQYDVLARTHRLLRGQLPRKYIHGFNSFDADGAKQPTAASCQCDAIRHNAHAKQSKKDKKGLMRKMGTHAYV